MNINLSNIYRDVLNGWKILILESYSDTYTVATYDPKERIEFWKGINQGYVIRDGLDRGTVKLHYLFPREDIT
jgi:hypothetical protein